MENEQSSTQVFGVSDFLAVMNQTLEYAFPSVHIVGEVSSFKVNQGKYVFFDLKDNSGTINCFMTVWQLRQPIEDGMKVVVSGVPKITQWGKFSITVQSIKPSGEGSLKKSFELLRAKLEKEGLFSSERKRPLLSTPSYVGVITSIGAAGYADFTKILNDRWGGVRVDVAHVQVQGRSAPDQIIRALKYFNGLDELPEILVIIRGGGSADDLSAFNDELLVREIASSRIPTLVGVGHEVDTSLADLVADVRAATPSNAAQILVPDKAELQRTVDRIMRGIVPVLLSGVRDIELKIDDTMRGSLAKIEDRYESLAGAMQSVLRVLGSFDPRRVLERGYAIVRGDTTVGSLIEIEQKNAIIKAKVESYGKK